jgi:hypothetical protein
MMKEWHFNVLFFVGVLGAVAMLLGPEIGIHIDKNPTAVTGVGAILGYILTQKPKIVKQPPSEEKEQPKKEEEANGV